MKAILVACRAVRLAMAALLLAGALAAQNAPATDDTLVDQVRVRLTSDADVNGGALEVVVREGVVTLRGPVRTEKAKKKAEKIAAKVKGVKKVLNEITVSPTA